MQHSLMIGLSKWILRLGVNMVWSRSKLGIFYIKIFKLIEWSTNTEQTFLKEFVKIKPNEFRDLGTDWGTSGSQNKVGLFCSFTAISLMARSDKGYFKEQIVHKLQTHTQYKVSQT